MNLRDISTTHIGMNYFAFMGGIQISAGVNLYVNLYAMNLSTLILSYLIIGGLLIFLGGYFSTVLMWEASKIIKEGEKAVGTVFKEEDKMNEKLNETLSIFRIDIKRITKIRMCFYSDVVLTGMGLILIFLSRIA
jgi:hypothetical protein